MNLNLRPGRWLIILPPLIFLLVFFLIPFAFAFKISFAQAIPHVPPFSEVLYFTPEHRLRLDVHLDNYRPEYLPIFSRDVIMLPFWTSFLLRVYALEGIIRDNGFLNTVLIHLGLLSEPLHIMHTGVAVYIGIVYSYLPFMVLPLYAKL